MFCSPVGIPLYFSLFFHCTILYDIYNYELNIQNSVVIGKICVNSSDLNTFFAFCTLRSWKKALYRSRRPEKERFRKLKNKMCLIQRSGCNRSRTVRLNSRPWAGEIMMHRRILWNRKEHFWTFLLMQEKLTAQWSEVISAATRFLMKSIRTSSGMTCRQTAGAQADDCRNVWKSLRHKRR